MISFIKDFLLTQVHFFSSTVGGIIFIIFYALWVISLLPGSWISMFAGFIYGPFLGSILVFWGAVLGAVLTFLSGRTLLRGWIQKRLSLNPKYELIEKSISREGLRLIILSRLSPAFPFGLLNLAYSVSSVKFKDFIIGLIAILPGTFLYCSLGSLASEISRFGQILDNQSEWKSFIFSLLGFISTALVVFIIFKSTKNALQDLD